MRAEEASSMPAGIVMPRTASHFDVVSQRVTRIADRGSRTEWRQRAVTVGKARVEEAALTRRL